MQPRLLIESSICSLEFLRMWLHIVYIPPCFWSGSLVSPSLVLDSCVYVAFHRVGCLHSCATFFLVSPMASQSRCANKNDEEGTLTPILSWPTNETQGAISQSLFVKLPPEILIGIFRNFPVPDLCKASLVCRAFKSIADRDEIWKSKCNSKYSALVSVSVALLS